MAAVLDDIAADPAIGEILIGEAPLQRRVRELGRRITSDYSGKPLLLVGLLRGSVVFLADLLRHVDMPVAVDFMATSSYVGRDSSGVVRLLKDLDHPIDHQHVLVVEDIIDTGLTLNYVLRILRARRPLSLDVCTLLNKPARRLIDLPVKYTGFDIPDAFVVGYGLDYNQRFRNLPFVGVLNVD